MFPVILLHSMMLAQPAPNVGVDESIVARIVSSLRDPDPDIRHNLAVALTKIGPTAVPPLIEALNDRSADMRAGAAYSLGQIGAAARAALPILLERLKDEDLNVRRQASYALSRILPEYQHTVPTKPNRAAAAGKNP